MADTKTANSQPPHAVATTTPPAGTFKELSVPAGDGALMYWPEQNGFIALFADEYREFYAEADEHSKKIAALQAANRKFTEAAVALREAQKGAVAANIKKAEAALEAAKNEMHLASAEVKKKLEPLSDMDAKKGVKMVELVSLRTPKYTEKAVPIYVTSNRLSKVLAENRIHLLSGEKEKRAQERVFKDGKLNTKEIKKRIVEKAQDKGFEKKWKIKPDDADAYTGVLGEWAKTMNGDIATFLERGKEDVEKKFNIDPKASRRNIDLSADAQLMRYTAGAGLEANFKPFKGNLDDQRDGNWYKRAKRVINSGECAFKANAQAAFAVAEGRVQADLYFPHCAGFHASLVAANGAAVFDLGYWRFFGSLMLSGSAGASVAVEIDVAISYTGGKQGIRGIPASQKDKKAVKARAGGGAELDVFAGVRAGVDLTGALQWLNPEGAKSNGKPLQVKPGEAVAEFKDMAKVNTGVAGSAGAGINGAFNFKHEDGKFAIYVKLGACFGLGGDANCKFEADADTIGEFFKCIAYQLKRADFHKLSDAINAVAYQTYSMVNYLIVAKGRGIEEYADRQLRDINDDFFSAVNSINKSVDRASQEAHDFLHRIRKELEKQTGSWLSYAPPEVLGQLARQVATAGMAENSALKKSASNIIALLLGAPQTANHLSTIAERMTLVMGDKQSELAGFSLMDACVAGTIYEGCLDTAQRRLAGAQPISSAPFIWNSDPEFVVASLAIEHPMYA